MDPCRDHDDLAPATATVGDPRNRRWRAAGIAFSLAWLLVPISDLLASAPPWWRACLALAGLAAFCLLYLGSVVRGDEAVPWQRALALAAMAALATALALADRSSWAMLFVFTAAAAGVRLPTRRAVQVVVALSALTAAVVLLAHGADGQLASLTATTLAIGLMMTSFGRLIRSNIELIAARRAVARLAVADERERFARDLHDLLGHSLSVIALKAELAGRLLPHQPQEAAKHVGELEGVARAALAEVREAVSGYRRPTLADELAGARMALEAAGIATRLDAPATALPPDVEAVLAWTVREGTTNVIRHSGARSCAIAVVPGPEGASAEIADDGRGPNGGGGEAGNGLAGLRERAAELRGRVEAGARPDGGFRLRVTVPLAAAEAAAT